MPNNKRYALIWFKQAQYDLDAAKTSKKAGNHEWACFQAQQAAEKALKAFLFFNKKRNIIIHSIRKLVENCGEINNKFLQLRKAKVLD